MCVCRYTYFSAGAAATAAAAAAAGKTRAVTIDYCLRSANSKRIITVVVAVIVIVVGHINTDENERNEIRLYCVNDD